MTENKSNLETRGRIEAIVERIKTSDAATCRILYEEIKREPLFEKAIRRMERDIAVDIALQRNPVTGPHKMTLTVTEQAHDKWMRGDKLGAISNYSAGVVVGIASIVPFVPLGDGAIELFRLAGVNIDPSPIHKAVNLATGTNAICNNLHEIAATKAGKPGHSKDKLPERLSEVNEGQIKAVRQMLVRLDSSLKAVAEDESKHPQMPTITKSIVRDTKPAIER
jgi:hypothetical protein